MVLKLTVILVGGLAALIAMLVSPIGPALVLLAITPFEGVIAAVCGHWGNAITYVPVLMFLVRTSPARWGRAFLGTSVQMVALVCMGVLFLSHAMGVMHHGPGVLLVYGQHVTLFIIMGILAFSMSSSSRLNACVKVLIFSMAVFAFLSMLDFYFGIRVLPAAVGEWGNQGVQGQVFQANWENTYRLGGAGIPVNRFANWSLLPIFLGLGWFTSKDRRWRRFVGGGCFVVLTLALLGSISRSGILGLLVGAVILVGVAFRFRSAPTLSLALVSVVVLGLGAMLARDVGVTQAVAIRFNRSRLESGREGRLARWMAGLEVFAHSPLIGDGVATFSEDVGREIHLGRPSPAHNAFITLLGQSGLFGFIPMVVLLALVVRSLSRSLRSVNPVLEHWRPYFLAGLIAMLVSNLFNDYLFERMLWVTFAYAAALEAAWRSSFRAAAGHGSEYDPFSPGSTEAVLVRNSSTPSYYS